MDWFTVDKAGLAKILERRGKEYALYELLSNAWDTSAGVVFLDMKPVPGRPLVEVIVSDDDPNGFKNLSDAWTLFSESSRKSDPTKRGRFCLGEKVVLALCEEAEIRTVAGGVRFDAKGRTRVPGRERGSEFRGLLRMTREEFERAFDAVKTVLPPIPTFVNGVEIVGAPYIASMDNAALQTEIADEEGLLRRRVRSTRIDIYDRNGVARLYEMGIPVVELPDDSFSVNIHQKVPVTLDREGVPPAFLRDVRLHVLTATKDLVSEEDANKPWVHSATEDPLCPESVMEKVLDLRFGEKRVSFDPSDPEANMQAVSKGYTVIYGSQLSGAQWENARKTGIVSAGRQFPTAVARFSPDGEDNTVPESRVPEHAKEIRDYIRTLAELLAGRPIGVVLLNTSQGFAACCGGGDDTLHLNVRRLGWAWFNWEKIDSIHRLVIHELGHLTEANHLSEAYHDALCNLGARLARLVATRPSLRRPFLQNVEVPFDA